MSTSTEAAACSVEPGTAEDVGAIVSSASPCNLHLAPIHTISASRISCNEYPFRRKRLAQMSFGWQIDVNHQVKGGGHASNPGFSSTTGVHIAMYRFSAVL